MQDSTFINPNFMFEYELNKAARVLVEDMFKLKKDEIFVITCDTWSDMRVVNATAAAAFSVGAKPMVITTATPLGTANMVDDFLPSPALLGALKEADAWVEYNYMYIFYSKLSRDIFASNKKLREMVLPGLTCDQFVRLFGRCNHKALHKFLKALTDMTDKAHHIRLTTELGQDVEFYNFPDEKRYICCDSGMMDAPGIYQMPGQIGWEPDFDTVNGTIVFDASLVPQIGPVDAPVKVTIEKGTIVKIEGGASGRAWDKFLHDFNDPQMLRVSHVCYGFHPGAKLTGMVGEDERIWGCTQWGFGSVAPCPAVPDGILASSHTDGISLNTTVYLDGKLVIDKGNPVDPGLKALVVDLGK
jgi:2,5-dihydroxypyridine 5,6-dioxygenase